MVNKTKNTFMAFFVCIISFGVTWAFGKLWGVSLVWAAMVSNTCLTDSCDCVFHIDAYTPVSGPMPINSSCVPCSAMVPSLRTTIRSACLMVDNRWAIAIVVLPLHTLVCNQEENSQSKQRFPVLPSRNRNSETLGSSLVSESVSESIQ